MNPHIDGCLCYHCVEARSREINANFRLEDLSHDQLVAMRDKFTEDSIYWWQWNCGIHSLSARQYRESMVKLQDENIALRKQEWAGRVAVDEQTKPLHSEIKRLEKECADLRLKEETARNLETHWFQKYSELKIGSENAPPGFSKEAQSIIDQDSIEIVKLRTTVAVLAGMLASAYDSD